VNGQQQDTQEFISYLLDSLHEDLNRSYKSIQNPFALSNPNVSFGGGAQS
jgi:ubiquitin C-terminal hydrolase